MNRILIMLLAAGLMAAGTRKVNNSEKKPFMKFNAGIVTPHLKETKDFYTGLLDFEVIFENDWFLLLQAPGGSDQLSFLLPGHTSQQALFHSAFGGKGVYLTIEVDDVDAEYERLKKAGVKLAIDIRNEPWGDRHFAIVDPSGVAVDIVKYTAPAN